MTALKSLSVTLLTILVVAASESLANSASVILESELTEPLKNVCNEDAVLFCSDVDHASRESLLKCLIEYENILSVDCASYIRNMSVGACNKDTLEFCSHIQTNGGLDQCIQGHTSELSPQCQWNVMRRNNHHTREKETERRSVRFSKAVTGLCGVYLLIPFALAVWAIVEMSTLNRKQAHFRKHANHHGLSPQENRNGTWSIEFHDLSYQIENTPPSWLLTSNKERGSSRRVLHKVSGLVRGAELTAIMGPVGSGKGSLLRVLSGRAFGGELRGLRAMNERVTFPQEYDRVMRRQGFVPCGAAQSDLLTLGLTVWQTLLHAALLRLPDTLTSNQIMHQAWEVLVFMELEPVADTVLSEEELRHNSRQLTELQIKCLQVAVSLLNRPEAIFLDQPTSSLSGADSVKFLKLLRKICRVYGTAVVITRNQPTAQEFALFHRVVVMGPMGHMLFSGSSTAAVAFFSSLADTTELAEFTFTDNDAATPGDIVFDILHQCGSLRGSPHSSSTDGSPYDVLPEAEAEREGLLSAADPRFVQVDVLDGDVEMQDLSGDSDTSSPQHGASRLQRAVTFIYQWFVVSEEYFFLQDRRAVLLGEERPSTHAAEAQKPFESPGSHHTAQDEPSGRNSTRDWDTTSAEPAQKRKKAVTAAPLTKIWVLFSSRLQVWSHDLNTIVLLTFQVFVAPLMICLAVGEVAHTELEKPKQAAGVLGWISVNALLLQCFLIAPSYFAERPVLDVQTGANSVSLWAHTVSTAVSDVMVAILVCTVTLSFAYVIHPLNPDTAHIAFAFLCFIVGTCAWQAFIRLIAELTGSKRMTMGVVALALCFGLYVNGVVTNAPHLSPYLYFTPYLSVSSVLSRALVANDLHCCYLSTTCAALAKEAARVVLANTTTAASFPCPVSVQFTGDGTDEGNLGRWYLQIIHLDEDRPHILLFALFWTNVIFRVATAFCTQRKNKPNLKIAASK